VIAKVQLVALLQKILVNNGTATHHSYHNITKDGVQFSAITHLTPLLISFFCPKSALNDALSRQQLKADYVQPN